MFKVNRWENKLLIIALPRAKSAENECKMNILQQIENENKAAAAIKVPDFSPGDTVRVGVRVIEGTRERIQVYEGVCIARRNAGYNSSFTVRKISGGEGVERIFPLYSPRVDSITIVRRGAVRQARIYYLRGRRGKSARVREKTDYVKASAQT